MANIASAMGVLVQVFVFLFVLAITSGWRFFQKAGRPGWHSIVPVYNLYVLHKIAEKPGWWMLLWAVPVVNVFFIAKVFLAVARAFSKGTGFAVGLMVLTPVFLPILADGEAVYRRPVPARAKPALVGPWSALCNACFILFTVQAVMAVALSLALGDVYRELVGWEFQAVSASAGLISFIGLVATYRRTRWGIPLFFTFAIVQIALGLFVPAPANVQVTAASRVIALVGSATWLAVFAIALRRQPSLSATVELSQPAMV